MGALRLTLGDERVSPLFVHLTPLLIVSQYSRVYDAPFFFCAKNEVELLHEDGQRSKASIQYNSIPNPLDTLLYFHVYWGRALEGERKSRLMRLRFCKPGVKSVSWKIYYLEYSSMLDLGQTECLSQR